MCDIFILSLEYCLVILSTFYFHFHTVNIAYLIVLIFFY